MNQYAIGTGKGSSIVEGKFLYHNKDTGQTLIYEEMGIDHQYLVAVVPKDVIVKKCRTHNND